MEQLLTVLATELGTILNVSDRVSVVFLEPGGEWMRIYRVLPQAEALEGPLPRVRVEGTPVGCVVRDGIGRVVRDVRADPAITFGHASHGRIRSTVSVPIRVGGRVVGAINAGSTTTGRCTEATLDQLREVESAIGPTLFASEQMFASQAKPAKRRPSSRNPSVGASGGLVGHSAAFESLIAASRRAAMSDADILITGETGVGKTALARAMHEWSPRANQRFVTVHIADLAPTIVESELFGHDRGAFTGAAADRVGRFESANGGTMFLDEIGETQPAIQSKLLRVVQDGCFERVGGSKTIEADVRVIAATSRDLHQLMLCGEFREDLFYRLNVVPLHVPALRDRVEDLEPLVESILARIGGERSRYLSDSAWKKVHGYSWPGNIRELECVLRRAVILEDGDALELEGFPPGARAGALVPDTEWATLDEHQEQYIVRVLQCCNGVIEGADGAAVRLGMRPSTLRSRMTRLGITSSGKFSTSAREKGQR